LYSNTRNSVVRIFQYFEIKKKFSSNPPGSHTTEKSDKFGTWAQNEEGGPWGL